MRTSPPTGGASEGRRRPPYFAQWVHHSTSTTWAPYRHHHVGRPGLLILSFYWWMSQKSPHPATPAPVAVDRLLRRLPVHLLAPDIILPSVSCCRCLPVATGRRVPDEEPHVPPLLVLIGLLGSALWMRLLWGGPDVIARLTAALKVG